MDCTEARTHLLTRRRGGLVEGRRAEVDAHLADCAACRHENAADALLGGLLEQRLPRPRAPASLHRALEERWLEPTSRARTGRIWARLGGTLLPMAAGAALALGARMALRPSAPAAAVDASGALVSEAVNDHLRVLYGDRPVEVESGGIHRVKPWFEGRLDFAPVVEFGGNDEFPLVGGSVAYFIDRKAATFVFKHRLHQITLFVFRAEGLRWPAVGLREVGPVSAAVETQRGFHVVLWQKGDLGYALVSDMNEGDLLVLAGDIVVPPKE